MGAPLVANVLFHGNSRFLEACFEVETVFGATRPADGARISEGRGFFTFSPVAGATLAGALAASRAWLAALEVGMLFAVMSCCLTE